MQSGIYIGVMKCSSQKLSCMYAIKLDLNHIRSTAES